MNITAKHLADDGHWRPITIEQLVFSGGEVQVRVLDDVESRFYSKIEITAHLRNSEDVFSLFMVTDALRRKYQSRPIILNMPYVPYARQDRVCYPGEALSLKVFCDLINSQGYERVDILDPHSDVTPALLNNVRVRGAGLIVEELYRGLNQDTILVAPDAGALKRVGEASKLIGCHMVRADKTRDPKTGEVGATKVYCEEGQTGDFLIVDDICDGGRTFIPLAQALDRLTTGKIKLYVTHGIFSRGLDVFDGVIDEVYVANSFVDLSKKEGFTHLRSFE